MSSSFIQAFIHVQWPSVNLPPIYRGITVLSCGINHILSSIWHSLSLNVCTCVWHAGGLAFGSAQWLCGAVSASSWGCQLPAFTTMWPSHAAQLLVTSGPQTLGFPVCGYHEHHSSCDCVSWVLTHCPDVILRQIPGEKRWDVDLLSFTSWSPLAFPGGWANLATH